MTSATKERRGSHGDLSISSQNVFLSIGEENAVHAREEKSVLHLSLLFVGIKVVIHHRQTHDSNQDKGDDNMLRVVKFFHPLTLPVEFLI